MNFLMTFLQGKLTYIVAAVSALWAIFGFFMGYITSEQTFAIVMASLAIFGIKRKLDHYGM